MSIINYENLYNKYKKKYLNLKYNGYGDNFSCVNPDATLLKDVCKKDNQGIYKSIGECVVPCLSQRKNLDEKEENSREIIDLFMKDHQKQNAREIIDRFMKRTKEAKEAKEAKEEKEEKAREIIGRFMKRTKHTRKSAFLKSICSDSGVCLAFGTHSDEIKKHFGGFVNFEYAVAPIKRIGAASANGFINEIQYKHKEYIAYAVLKSAMREDTDNLMYEYLVGQYINKLNKLFPCFLETYGYYTYNNNEAWKFLKNTIIIDNIDAIKKDITLRKTTDYAVACKESKYLAILIQHLKGIIPIIDGINSPEFIKNELLNVLFQVYLPLHVKRDTFTHYDLHLENVNLFEPKKDSYIEFHYTVEGHTYSFKSKYIAKIIDYGRSYFVDTDADINSKKIYKELCRQPECRPYCGYSKGFQWMEDKGEDADTAYWISSQKRNKSHDLRLLNEIKDVFKDNSYLSIDAPIVIKNLLYSLRYDDVYGTPELDNGYPQIHNVSDALKMLMVSINTPGVKNKNELAYAGKLKLGDLYIYDDGTPMRFEKV
jgi:hypothetical protein